MIIHYNGRIFILNTRLSLEGWKGLLSSRKILLCFMQKHFEVSVMILVVPVPCSRAPGTCFKEGTLLAADPRPVLLSLSRGRI